MPIPRCHVRTLGSFILILAVLADKFTFGQTTNNSALPFSASSNQATIDNGDSVILEPDQLAAVKIATIQTYQFPVVKEEIGSVAYAGNPANDPGAKTPDSDTKSIVINVTESDSPYIHVNQPVVAKVLAYPGNLYSGTVTVLGGNVYDSGGNPSIDPNTRRIVARCEIADPKNELFPGMLADVTVQIQPPVESVAIPVNGVVRNGDGTMAAWVTTDRHKFLQRIIQVGEQRDGRYQVLAGLRAGETAVIDGAIFLSNMLEAPPTD